MELLVRMREKIRATVIRDAKTWNPSAADTARVAMFSNTMQRFFTIECALGNIMRMQGDSKAVLDVMADFGWAPSEWNKFRRVVREDRDFQIGLAEAGFWQDWQGAGRFVRVAQASERAQNRLVALEAFHVRLDEVLKSAS
jgi:hypothetical protein